MRNGAKRSLRPPAHGGNKVVEKLFFQSIQKVHPDCSISGAGTAGVTGNKDQPVCADSDRALPRYGFEPTPFPIACGRSVSATRPAMLTCRPETKWIWNDFLFQMKNNISPICLHFEYSSTIRRENAVEFVLSQFRQ
ncbi:hypothetical protein BaRGS_00003489 [Batillaria attramentaria]|uniref:Uncharacterized protein n=1 Tax=Batillaria attramentaria TaxID=370345 RepID=A0ABD0M109_9CAEN